MYQLQDLLVGGHKLQLFNTNKTCPTCKGKMYFVNEKFKAPKKSNDKEWKIIRVFVVEWL